jgi:hypothetical protein
MNVRSSTLPSLHWSYANTEALKWFAFVCMVIDHANKVIGHGEWSWAVPIGRIAFPLFAFVIGRHLGEQGTATRLLKRLVVFGLLATPVYVATVGRGHALPLNILWTFAAALVIVQLIKRDRFMLAGFVALVAAPLVDYHAAGLGIILASWLWWEHRNQFSAFLLAVALAGLCWFNGNPWAMLAVPFALMHAMFDWQLPRHRWFFWLAYPLHIAALGLVVIVIGV